MAGRRQTALGAYLTRLSNDAYQHDRAVILLNRVASVVSDGNDREIDIGGETVRHFAQKVLYLRRSGEFVMASRPDQTRSNPHEDNRRWPRITALASASG